MKTLYLRSLLAAAAFVPVAASANPAITTQGVNMRAGPIRRTAGRISRPGHERERGRVRRRLQWCDVVAGPNRGWVYSGYLSYSYYDRPTLISYGGPTLGIPLISFAIGPYWDNYYRGRPFWNQRAYWYSHRVARAPEWHAPPGWHGNDWRAHDNGRGNDGEVMATGVETIGARTTKGVRRATIGPTRTTVGRIVRTTIGRTRGSNSPDNRPNDQFHPNAQQ
jgi:uncharacterized protein YraI